MPSRKVLSDSPGAENIVSVTGMPSPPVSSTEITALPAPKLPSKFKMFYDKSGTPVPTNPHLTLMREDVKDYVVFIGDVHGCADELEELISLAPQNSTFICVGDLVFKGPDSRRTVEIVREKGLSVRGNNDDSLIAAYYRLGKYKVDEPTKHFDTINQMKNYHDLMEYLAECPITISLPFLNLMICHAGVLPGKEIDQQEFKDLLWIRHVKKETNPNNSNEIIFSHGKKENKETNVTWGQEWKGGKGRAHIIFGHDSAKGLQEHEFATGLDTGCCYGGHLTAMVCNSDDFSDRSILQVKAKKVYEVRK